MAKWTEVDIYTGLVKKVDEDAPANSVAGGGVALPPDAMMKKKKKRLIDARTKEYRQHRARLEKLRAQRQAKTNNINEEQISEMKKVEIKLHPRNIDKTIQKIVKHIGIENRGRRTKIQVIQNMSDDSVTLDGRGADVGRQVADIRNFIGFKSAKVIESVEEETLDEQFDYVLLDKDNKIIARYKGRDAKKQAELNKKGAEKKLGVKKPIKVYPIRPTDKKKIGDTVLAIGEETLDEAKKISIEFDFSTSDRKAQMQKVIDFFKKNHPKFKLEPKGNILKVDGRGKSLARIGKDIYNNYYVKKVMHEEVELDEAKLIDKPTGEVLKTGSKKEMETERKRNRDELQVKEWFKSKGIDVTIRKLDDATQAYVRLGKIIPNEIREELVKIQYGELPVEFQDKNNIVYGNFKENSITMNNEFWKKVFEARKDDPSQEQDTNIIMQLRKSVSLRGMKDVEFNDGKKVKVKPKIATAVMDKFNSYRTTDEKLKFQQKIAKSYKDLLSALKEK